MISTDLTQLRRFCDGDIKDIEGYEEAVSSAVQWDCHHRNEIQPDGVILSAKWMKEHNIYYHCLPCQLVFLPHSEHVRLHNLNRSSEAIQNHLKAVQNDSYRDNQSKDSLRRWKEHKSDYIKSRNGLAYKMFGMSVKELSDLVGIPMGSIHYKIKNGEVQRRLSCLFQ